MHKLLPLLLILVISSGILAAQSAPSSRYKEIILDESYDHDKWGIEPNDLKFEFAAFTCSFDSDDDNDGDGSSDIWGIPEWVAYEVKRENDEGPGKYSRPSKWMTHPDLLEKGIVPHDDTYLVSGVRSMKEVKTDYRYVRGHMCPKDVADRISMNAGYNTHTTLNAVPQLQWQNNGIWKDLEKKVTKWADEYEQIWVICGPVFFNKVPAVWLGQKDEVKAAVPDALYKIVIRASSESDTGIETLAFLIPNVIPKEKKDLGEFITSISRIEDLTDIQFLMELDSEKRSLELKKESKDFLQTW